MCEPTTMAMMALSGGQAALGIAGSNRALAARNRNRARLYEYDKLRIHAEHLVNISNYYLRGADAEIEWSDNAIQASQATDAQQVVINESLANALRANPALAPVFNAFVNKPAVPKAKESKAPTGTPLLNA